MTLEVVQTKPGQDPQTEIIARTSKGYDVGKIHILVVDGTINGTGIKAIGKKIGPFIINPGYDYPQGGLRIPPGTTMTIENSGESLMVRNTKT